MFRKKHHTMQSVAQYGASPMSYSEILKVSERIAKALKSAGLNASITQSRKSESTYVHVEHPEKEDLGTVTIRVSDHYYPDRHAYLEKETDYQVFTGDIYALVATIKSVMQKFGVENPKLLETMISRSQAAKQRAGSVKRRSFNEILADMISDYAQEILQALDKGEAVIQLVDDPERPYMRLLIQNGDSIMLVAYSEARRGKPDNYWKLHRLFLVYGKRREVIVRVPMGASASDAVKDIAGRLNQIAEEVRAKNGVVGNSFLTRWFN